MSTKRKGDQGKRTARADVAAAPLQGGAGRWWLWPGAALLVAVLVYWPALKAPFIFDDFHLPFTDPKASQGGVDFWLGGVRPILMATYWANFITSGTAPFFYHATNIVLHVITTVLVFFVLERLFDLAGLKLNRRWSAFFGAGLFLLHPLQTEAVAYVAGRSEEVAGLFFFAAWLVFLNNFRTQMRLVTSMKILALAGVAVLSKESAISLPAIFLITDLFWNHDSLREQIRNRARFYLPMAFAGLIAATVILHSLTAATSAGFSIPGVTPGVYALTQCRVILTYIRLFLLPVGQNADWGMPFYHSLSDVGASLCMLGIIGILAAIAWSYRRAPLLSFGLLAFLILLLPTSSIVPIKDALAERRMYVPILGLIIVSVWFMDRMRPGAQTLRTATICILALAGALTFHRSAVWGDDLLFWRDSVDKNPENSRAHIGLGNAYFTRTQCDAAIGEFEVVERQNGVTDEMLTNLAAAYQCKHRPDLALRDLRSVVLGHPSANLYAQIGYLEAASGHADEAMAALNEAISRDPENALAYAYRGVLRVATGKRAEATEDLQRSLQLAPGNPTAIKGMSMLLGRN